MKKTKVAAIGAASILAVVALLIAVPAMAATQNTTLIATSAATSTTTTTVVPAPAALTVGQTITFTSTNGVWKVASSSPSTVKTGPASGTMTLTVTGAFKGGYALTLTSGSVSINGTTYSFGAGTAEMGPHQAHLVGEGMIAGPTPGSFLFLAGAHANFQGSTYNTLRLDVQVNGQEFGVLLLATATVS